ncbi:MAG: cell wall anchor protein [Microbacteriaceae bacterium]|nr:cell wall anchor protein [Microbacteriaceae bacterium]
MKKIFVAAAIALAAVLIPATAANAYGEISGPNAVSTGGSGTYVEENIPAGVTSVDFTVTGPGEAILSASISKTVVNGTATINAVFPVSGVYTVTATGTGFTNSIAVTATIAPADLASTGINPTSFVWFGGGILALGLALVVVLMVIRRNGSRATV